MGPDNHQGPRTLEKVAPHVYVPGQREIVLILGKTGSGKTTLAKHLAQAYTRTLLVDADFKEFPCKYFSEFDALCAGLEVSARPGGFFRFGYTPYSNEYPLMFDVARNVGPCHLILEEADRFPDPAYCLEYEEIIARGRHYGVNIVALSRYPYALPSMLRREASRILVFRHHEPRDVDWLYKVMGDSAELLPQLGAHEFLDWTPSATDLKPQKVSI